MLHAACCRSAACRLLQNIWLPEGCPTIAHAVSTHEATQARCKMQQSVRDPEVIHRGPNPWPCHSACLMKHTSLQVVASLPAAA